MKNTLYYALLAAGTAALLTGFYAIEMDITWRTLLAGSGILLLTVFYLASMWRICFDKTTGCNRKKWLLTTALLPVFGGILFLILQEE